jgi:hypothetical protein
MVELALYAAYPLLLLGYARRFSEKAMWRAIAAVWVVGVAAITIVPGLQWWWHNSSLFGFLPYWWLGVALFNAKFADFVLRRGAFIFAAWAAMVIAMQIVPALAPVVEARKLLFALCTCYAILRLDRPDFRFRGLSEIGKAGYSVYAFHAPICYTSLVMGLPWWAAASIAIGFGYCSYLWIERPFLSLGKLILLRKAAQTA